jgi:hypothetical protein
LAGAGASRGAAFAAGFAAGRGLAAGLGFGFAGIFMPGIFEWSIDCAAAGAPNARAEQAERRRKVFIRRLLRAVGR